MKKITILKHGGGELANQLWNYISIYAYGLEIGVPAENPSFFEHHQSFNLIAKEGFVARFFSFWFKNSSGRRADLKNRFWRNAYLVHASLAKLFIGSSVASSENKDNMVVYLPPTSTFDSSKKYFIGWLFRNPAGLEKFRNRLIQDFKPNQKILEKIDAIIKPLRQKYEKIIGIHIRQADYKNFKGGAYFVDQARVREIIEEYIKNNKLDRITTAFLITSDGPINADFFRNLNIYISKENAVTDLFLLTSCNAIIGSDSSFGAFSSWYGDIPHIVMKKDPVDWAYYADKKGYFENKYSKMVQY